MTLEKKNNTGSVDASYVSASVAHNASITAYPDFPYASSEQYPEYTGTLQATNNPVYAHVRQVLIGLGLDAQNVGNKAWNPFKELVQPGQTVLIKPNWVRDFNPIDANIDSLVTHTSVLRPIIDYILIALHGKGKIIIADAPLQNCDFDRLMAQNRVKELLDLYRPTVEEVKFEVLDLRKTVLKRLSLGDQLKGAAFQFNASGDPHGYTLVNIEQESLLTDLDDRCDRFRVTNYDHTLLKLHHNKTTHEYLVANAILHADVIINVPKMKTHIKAGVTGALKNLVGINGHKEFLPHHMNGSYFEGGDQYMYPSRIKELYNRVYDHFWSHHRHQTKLRNKAQSFIMTGLAAISRLVDRENLYDGGWFGNETIPRTTIDLNHILYYYDHTKKELQEKPVRKVLHLIDGIIAGEGTGPLRPTAKPAGVLIASMSPLIADFVMARMIGYNPIRIKTLFYGLYHRKSRLVSAVPTHIADLSISYNQEQQSLETLPNLGFVLPTHWRQCAQERK